MNRFHATAYNKLCVPPTPFPFPSGYTQFKIKDLILNLLHAGRLYIAGASRSLSGAILLLRSLVNQPVWMFVGLASFDW